MGIKLNVPILKQYATGECWYACVCMIAWYRKPGPRIGLPDIWARNTGITGEQFIELAKAEGMKSCSDPPYPWDYDVTTKELERLLRQYGPIWCAGVWDGPEHVIVLTGVEGEIVYFNDPNGGLARQKSLEWFNGKLIPRIPNHMMYMPPGGGR